jgi:hypothetical protein
MAVHRAAQAPGEGNKLKKDKAASSPTSARGTFFKQGGSKAPTADELSWFLHKLLRAKYPEKLMARFQLFVKDISRRAREGPACAHPRDFEHYSVLGIVAASGASLAMEQEQSRGPTLVRRQEYGWSARALVCGSLWGHCALCEDHIRKQRWGDGDLQGDGVRDYAVLHCHCAQGGAAVPRRTGGHKKMQG